MRGVDRQTSISTYFMCYFTQVSVKHVIWLVISYPTNIQFWESKYNIESYYRNWTCSYITREKTRQSLCKAHVAVETVAHGTYSVESMCFLHGFANLKFYWFFYEFIEKKNSLSRLYCICASVISVYAFNWDCM